MLAAIRNQIQYTMFKLPVLCYSAMYDNWTTTSPTILFHLITSCIYNQERATCNWVRACDYLNLETGWNLPPVLKIVTHTAHAAYK